jgi:hypothetical protein
MQSDRHLPAFLRNFLSSSPTTLKMEATGSSEMLVSVYYIAWCHITKHWELLENRDVTGMTTQPPKLVSHTTYKKLENFFTNCSYTSFPSAIKTTTTTTTLCIPIFTSPSCLTVHVYIALEAIEPTSTQTNDP